MVVQKFSECFWTADFVSTVGFDILVKRNKDGKNSSKEIEGFIKERVKIEDDYAKCLLKLSKASLGTTETGTLKDNLVALKNDVEKLSYLHQDLSHILQEQVHRMNANRERLTTQCKVAEESVKRLQIMKKDLHSKTMSAMQSYQKKSEAYEVSTQNYLTEKAQSQNSTNPKVAKELEKLDGKALKCKEEKLRADDNYQGLVRQLEVARTCWETEMENMCDTFQRVEQERITFFRNELWAHTNFDSKTLYDRDQANEETRLVIERCDAERDIQDFIESYQTGSVRPAPIVYTEYDPSRGTFKAPGRAAPLRPVLSASSSGSTFFTKDTPASDPRHQPHTNLDDDPTYSSIS